MTEKPNYTQKQAEVIRSEEKRLLVMSCAGSGKTFTIVERIRRLLAEGILPQAIIVLSFSNKSVQDIRKKLNSTADELSVTVQTFHSLGLEVIKKYYKENREDQKVKIIADIDRKKWIREICGEYKIDAVDDCSSYIRAKKNFDRLRKAPPLFEEIYERYCARLQEEQLIDMEDLIRIPIDLLSENKELAGDIRSSHQFIFVDEYQDTNEAQNRLLDLITTDETHLCLVGDDDQSIYEWRGARPQYIRDKATSGEFHVVKLEENFRSSWAIVETANHIIRNNQNRIPKKMVAATTLHCPEVKPFFRQFSGRYFRENQTDEAEYVASTIKKLVGSGKFNFSDIAVLYRLERQTDALIPALKNAKIPFEVNVMEGGNQQFLRFMSVLKSIVSWDSAETINAAVNFPTRCLDLRVFRNAKETYMRETGDTQDRSPLEWMDCIYRSSVHYDKHCEIFRERYRVLTQLRMAQNWSAQQALRYLMQQYFPEYMGREPSSDCPTELLCIRQVFDLACTFEKSFGSQSMAQFVEKLGEVVDSEEYGSSSGSDAVTLMTMHRSKGLEFKVVFVVGVQVGTFPNDYYIDGQSEQEDAEALLEGERRLFYVAVTRARELLFLTSCANPLVGSTRPGSVIGHGFMAEIPELLQASPFDERILERFPPAEERRLPIETASSDAIMASLTAKQSEEALQELAEETGASARGENYSLTDLSEDMLKEYRNLAYELALQGQYELPDDVFIVVIGDMALDTTKVKQTVRKMGIKKCELYGYHGEGGFNAKRLFQNYHCAGIIMGPVAHKLPSVGERSLKELLKQEGFPYTVDLIDEKITKQSLKDALIKIKWAYFKEQEKYKNV